MRDVGGGEPPIDAGVGGDVGDEVIDNGRYRWVAAEPVYNDGSFSATVPAQAETPKAMTA